MDFKDFLSETIYDLVSAVISLLIYSYFSYFFFFFFFSPPKSTHQFIMYLENKNSLFVPLTIYF